MHPNPIFRRTDEDATIRMARERGFGVLSLNDPDGNAPLLAHVPFLVSGDGQAIDLHLVRSNPIARVLSNGPVPAVIAVSGPDGYVSPDWYGVEDQVPTWNYVAVHLRGTARLLPDNELRDVIDRLSEEFETRLLPKPVWRSEKMSPGVMERMMRSIVPVQLRIEHCDATWKLSQNKPDSARLGAAEGMSQSDVGHETRQLSRLMESPPDVKGTPT